MNNIRNFSIIAHIDHGKSTLADRLIQYTGMVEEREFRDQILDTMDIERERGITIKSNTITLPYTAKDGGEYDLNLIDTPGHVDFSYEVSRALASCEGVLLLVDASQGVQAQTLANLYLAMEHDLAIIPVINKIDLPSADVDAVKEQIDRELGLDPDTGHPVFGQRGHRHRRRPGGHRGADPAAHGRARGAPDRPDLRRPLRRLTGAPSSPAGSLTGAVQAGDTIRFMFNSADHKVEEVGLFRLHPGAARRNSSAGEVGYLIAGIKTVSDTRIGDTITLDNNPAAAPLPGFKEVKPVVFSSIYPVASDDYQDPGRRPGKIQAQRRLPGLPEGLLRGPGPGFPLRLPGAAAPGDRPGAPGAGVRPVHHHDRAQRPLRFTLTDGHVVAVDNPQYYPDPSRIRERRRALHPGGASSSRSATWARS